MAPRRLTRDQIESLPPPTAIEPLDYEQILDQCKTDLASIEPMLDVDSLPESDPIVKVLEVLAYRELYVRQRINETILGAFHHVAEDGVDEGTMPQFETTGSSAAYEYFVRYSTDEELTEVRVQANGQDRVGEVTIACIDESGATPVLTPRLTDRLWDDQIRPLNHRPLYLDGPLVEDFTVSARLGMLDTPGADIVVDTARKRVCDYLEQQYRFGATIFRDALIGALSLPGVWYVILNEPSDDIYAGDLAAPHCTNIAEFGSSSDPYGGDIRIDTDAPEPLTDDALTVLGYAPMTLQLRPPEFEARLTHYSVRWGDAAGVPLPGLLPIAEPRAGETSIGLPPAPSDAESLVVFTANQNGEAATAARLNWPPDASSHSGIGEITLAHAATYTVHGCRNVDGDIEGTWAEQPEYGSYFAIRGVDESWFLMFRLSGEMYTGGATSNYEQEDGSQAVVFSVSENGGGEFPFPVDVVIFDLVGIPECDPDD